MRKHFIAAMVTSASLATSIATTALAAAAPAPKIDADDIGGLVTGPKGPEAGVWVIAETKDLATQYVKIVVTDDQGRFVIPDLPKAKYKIWSRGYGLLDSKPVEGSPGGTVNLTNAVATPKEAAEIYPANYWFSLIKPPADADFPGTGPSGNGINPGFMNRQDWMGHLKEQCEYCHQIGDRATRTVIGTNHVEAWDQRIQKAREPGDITLGPHGKEFSGMMVNNMTRFGKARGLSMFADWTIAIEKGALPPSPPRPSGLERNVVMTLWDFAGGHFIHDEASSDKRDPTVNANGPVYGVDTELAHLEILDPTTHENQELPVPGLTAANQPQIAPNSISVHNPMLDQQGRVWITMLGGEGEGWATCADETGNKWAKYYPNGAKTTRRIAMYDPKTKKIEAIPVCYNTHHLNFGRDKDNTLYFSGDTNVLGWMNTRVFDETKDSAKAMGWCPFVLDTNGDGKIDPNRNNWNKPDGVNVKMEDPKKDTRISGFPYGMNISPKDDSIWYAKHSPTVPSGLVRLERGVNPPETCKTEYYEPPKGKDGNYVAYNARGVDLDSKGVAWVAFGSGQIASFDRTKCKVMNGPTAIGQQCPEGWTFYDSPGPKITGESSGSADWHYLTWVDLHDSLGLGKDVPIVPGSNSDSLIALMPDKKWVVLRVPYPLGFYTRGLDGRIDDRSTGWKGKGVWANYGEVPLWHQEEGEGSVVKMVKFQVRPDPLAH